MGERGLLLLFDQVQVDLGSVRVPVGPHEDLGLDDPALAAVGDVEGSVLLPDGDLVAVVALDDAGVLVEHAPRGGQLAVDELQGGGVLVDAALVDQEVDGGLDAVLLVDVERGVGDVLGDLVDDHDAGLEPGALPGGLGLGAVAHDDRRGDVVVAVLAQAGAGGEGDDGRVLCRAHDQLARGGDDGGHGGLGHGLTFCGIVLEKLAHSHSHNYAGELTLHGSYGNESDARMYVILRNMSTPNGFPMPCFYRVYGESARKLRLRQLTLLCEHRMVNVDMNLATHLISIRRRGRL